MADVDADVNAVVLGKHLKDDFLPAVPDELVTRVLQTVGVEWPDDPEDRANKTALVRLIGLSAQHFIKDAANEALAKPKQRSLYLNPDAEKSGLAKVARNVRRELEDGGYDERAARGGAGASKRKKKADDPNSRVGTTLRLEDVQRVMEDRGIRLRRPELITDDR